MRQLGSYFKLTPSRFSFISTLHRWPRHARPPSLIKARLADLGGAALALSPADFGKLIADETGEHQAGVTLHWRRRVP